MNRKKKYKDYYEEVKEIYKFWVEDLNDKFKYYE
jgi:hypothetical protein